MTGFVQPLPVTSSAWADRAAGRGSSSCDRARGPGRDGLSNSYGTPRRAISSVTAPGVLDLPGRCASPEHDPRGWAHLLGAYLNAGIAVRRPVLGPPGHRSKTGHTDVHRLGRQRGVGTRAAVADAAGPLLRRKPRSQALRVAVTVPDGNHLDPLLLDAKQHGVGESTKQGRVNTALVGGEGPGEPSNAREALPRPTE